MADTQSQEENQALDKSIWPDELDDIGNMTFFKLCELLSYSCQALHPNDSSAMEECFLDKCFPPRSLSLEQAWPLTVVYGVIFIVGLLGNSAVCIVSSSQNWLQSITSDYLLNLAIADLVSLLSGLPFEVYSIWHQYPFIFPDIFCHLKGLLSETTFNVSALTILSFTLERYFAICHSLALRRRLSMSRSPRPILIGIWVVAAAFAIPYGIHHEVEYVMNFWPADPDYGPVKQTKMCMLPLAFNEGLMYKFRIIMHISSTIFFILPMTVIIGCYISIACSVRQANRLTSLIRTDSGQRAAKNQRKTLLILAAVVTTFFACYAPYQVQRVLFFYGLDNLGEVNQYLFMVSGILFYMSSIMNPVLYNLLSSNFRRSVRVLIFRLSIKRSPRSNVSNQARSCHGVSVAERSFRMVQVIQQSNGHTVSILKENEQRSTV